MAKCCDYKTSDFRHLITIEQEVNNDDDMGGSVVTWSTRSTAYAMIKQLSQGERFYYGAIHPEATHKFVIRYQADIVSSDRVSFDGRLFNIQGPPENLEERNRYLVILAKEGVAQ